ncbi:MAG TPA: ORF6N domain-containing protein [Burkholderiaceae bacterium]|nr:ORF6N domain-containing protein [Burkholderiaceae bacterium]
METIAARIVLVRGQKVLLDADLAVFYGVQTRALVQAVKRNLDRFPDDFMFQLSNQELAVLRSQTVISSATHGGRRYAPYAFTEQGVAMLSSVLNSTQAIRVNIAIMRAFVKLREMPCSSRAFLSSGSVIDRLIGGRPEVEHDRRPTQRSWAALRHEDTDHVLVRVHVQRCAERSVPAVASRHAGHIERPRLAGALSQCISRRRQFLSPIGPRGLGTGARDINHRLAC